MKFSAWRPDREPERNWHKLFVRNSKGTEATLSGWKPGKLTLKPGIDLVRKVWEVWKTEMAFD